MISEYGRKFASVEELRSFEFRRLRRLEKVNAELLEALKQLVPIPTKHRRPDKVWEQARAAIRQAEEA